MASYFEELAVPENESDEVRVERLTRETFRMMFDHNPGTWADTHPTPPPASKAAIEKLKVPSAEELSGKIRFMPGRIQRPMSKFVKLYFLDG